MTSNDQIGFRNYTCGPPPTHNPLEFISRAKVNNDLQNYDVDTKDFQNYDDAIDL